MRNISYGRVCARDIQINLSSTDNISAHITSFYNKYFFIGFKEFLK
jgi:hypothetical protein